jgi:hypothetical protein
VLPNVVAVWKGEEVIRQQIDMVVSIPDLTKSNISIVENDFLLHRQSFRNHDGSDFSFTSTFLNFENHPDLLNKLSGDGIDEVILQLVDIKNDVLIIQGIATKIIFEAFDVHLMEKKNKADPTFMAELAPSLDFVIPCKNVLEEFMCLRTCSYS